MSSLDSEMFKRTWWCMYVLDRRVSLVLGRPFMIQDNVITVALPRDIDVSTPGSVFDFYHMETESNNISLVAYLKVMVGYSRLVGKVWETLFGADSGSKTSPHIQEYLDSLVHVWMESVPKFLVCDQNDVHQPPISSAYPLFKQRFLIRLVRQEQLGNRHMLISHSATCTSSSSFEIQWGKHNGHHRHTATV